MDRRIRTPLDDATLRSLRAGDSVLISGEVLTARDAAHKRLVELLDKGEDLPITLKGATLYYVGPCPAKPGQVIGSAGPTTSGRMDAYAPRLIALGLRGMVGKGLRSQAVIDAMKKHGAVYFAAIGGAGALIARSVRKCEVVAYSDLGPEAIHRLTVEDLPAIVAIDATGESLYETGKQRYRAVSVL